MPGLCSFPREFHERLDSPTYMNSFFRLYIDCIYYFYRVYILIFLTVYIYIYIYIYMCVCVYIYIYIYIYKETQIRIVLHRISGVLDT